MIPSFWRRGASGSGVGRLFVSCGLAIATGSLIHGEGEAQTPLQEPLPLAPFTVTADRTLPERSSSSIRPETLTLLDLDSESPASLDALLKKNPAISTYRRASSLAAHPTTQGVRMRNAATNATSRTLVLLDGIPQNDPFGGWVEWNRLPLRSTDRIHVYSNGQNGAWGNLSAGGVISLNEPDPFEDHGYLVLQAGTLTTLNAAAGQVFRLDDKTVLTLDGALSSSAGYIPVAEEQRGPIDTEAWSEYAIFGAGIEHRFADTHSARLNLNLFGENRGNGTPEALNQSRGFDASIQVDGTHGPTSAWQATLFYQDRGFSNIFTSVNDDRTEERPALDQYDVPAASTGFSFNWTAQTDERWGWVAGADLRAVDGNVNEYYRNLGNGFTRDRSAGGDQQFAGVFARLRFLPESATTLEATLRVDNWRLTDGYRRESDLATGDVLTDLAYPNRSGWEPTVELSATRQLNEDWATRLSVFRGFRAPTLNELYRPFRVRNDITESNPELKPETSLGVDVSLVYQKAATMRAQFGVFGYELTDMITNVLHAYGPGFSPICGFIPEGGSCSRRENVENSRVWGAEFRYEVSLTSALNASFEAVYSETSFQSESQEQGLNGNAFPHAPLFRVMADLRWDMTEDLNGMVRLNATSSEYEDALNNRELASSTTIDLVLDYRWPEKAWSLGLAIDNLLDSRVEAGLASDGLLTVAEPRMVRLTARWRL